MAGASVSGGVAVGWWIRMWVFCFSVAGGADPGCGAERFSERFFSRFEFTGFESGCLHPPTGTSAFPRGSPRSCVHAFHGHHVPLGWYAPALQRKRNDDGFEATVNLGLVNGRMKGYFSFSWFFAFNHSLL
jgi:hypothetical protein